MTPLVLIVGFLGSGKTTFLKNLMPALAVGGVIGLLSGLTGTGGGIFLTPLLLQLRWAQAKRAAAVSALFILVNSVAGLAGILVLRAASVVSVAAPAGRGNAAALTGWVACQNVPLTG